MILIKLIFAHLIGDFFLQPKKWITDKEKRTWTSPYLYLHSFLHFGLILLILWDISYWTVALFVAGSHLLIDGAKVQLQTEQTRSLWFGTDQILHIFVLVAVWMMFWSEVSVAMPGEPFWIMITGIVFLTYPSSYIMMNMMNRWNEQINTENEDSLESAGMYIGMLERIFIFTAILSGYWQIIGFLLAAKSVFRFGDLTRAKNRKLTEYILIGTLMSFLIAITTGLATVRLLS